MVKAHFYDHGCAALSQTEMYFCSQVLLTFMWFRRYPTMHHLAMHFAIPVSCVHKILHTFIKLLHVYLVPKYIKWHSMAHWRNLAGTYPEWPRVVAIVDCTPFRISKPTGYLFTCIKYQEFS